METLAVLGDLWGQWLWPVLQLVVGLGLVVFVHELGHFVVAKSVGIKVERFALGFGPRLFGIRRGETDYSVMAVPLGGYVKMLGQEDFAPVKDGESDPRAYNNKSVGARFAVISAGVVMNLILAAVLFVIVGLVGRDVIAPVIGGLSEGFPAAEARITWEDPPPTAPATQPGEEEFDRLQPGDEVLSIRGDSVVMWMKGYRVTSFSDLMITAALADADDVYTFTIRRVRDGREYIGHADVGVRLTKRSPVFGIQTPLDIVIGKNPDAIVNSPFKPGDRIVSIAGRPVEYRWQIEPILETLTGEPVPVVVQRGEKHVTVEVQPKLVTAPDVQYLVDGTKLHGTIQSIEREGEQRKATIALAGGGTTQVPADSIVHDALVLAGLIPRLKVSGVLDGSPAEAAGVRPGDVVVSYGDRSPVTFDEFRRITERAAEDGTRLVVLRDGTQVELDVNPEREDGRAQVGLYFGPELAGTEVAGVLPDTPAARAGIRPGARITEVAGRSVSTWTDVYQALLDAEASGADEPITVRWEFGVQQRTGELTGLAEFFEPEDYTFRLLDTEAFNALTVYEQQDGVMAALTWGVREAVRMTLSTYVSLRSLITGTVSAETLSGPIGIGAMALEAGRTGLMNFVFFLAFISTALAVFNFLPLPVVDGGHAVFLLIEKIRGKPVPARIMNAAQVVGLVLILALVLFVTWNDIQRILGG